ncbi:MAG: aryl-sulfate sulfotransferase [Chitinispirillaceae bacterium]|nr:aryl-sulfate sulfotransferase [Chitinispirillaceae bacterium]
MLRKCTFMCLFMAVLFYSGALMDAAAISEGYILASNYSARTTELFDRDGNIVHTWNHTVSSGYSCYLLENGNLLRGCTPINIMSLAHVDAQPSQGMIEEVDSAGNQIWSDTLADKTYMMHHDFKPMPDGNIIGVQFVTVTKAAAVNAGVDTSVFFRIPVANKNDNFQSEMIFVLKPDRSGGKKHQIIWKWFVMDHVASKDSVAAHPELFDGTHPTWARFPKQWFHINGIDYNPAKKLILFSSRVFSETYVIEYSDSSEIAKAHAGGVYGKGGDILYRWGHPSNYVVEFTGLNDTLMQVNKKDTLILVLPQRKGHAGDLVDCMHCPTWIPEGYRNAGNIMFYHNNVDPSMRQLGLSQVIEINPWDAGGTLLPMTSGSPTAPLPPTWVYNPVDSMYSASMSTAIRMRNGNTLVHEAYPGGNKSGKSGSVREIDPSGQLIDTVITLKQASGYNPPKVMYYPPDHPGIVKLLGPVPAEGKGASMRGAAARRPAIYFHAGRINVTNIANADVALYSLQGKRVALLHAQSGKASIPAAQITPGSYLVRVKMAGGGMINRLINIER